jgi:hypothetical protein
MQIKQHLKLQALGSPAAIACVPACRQFVDLLDGTKQASDLRGLEVRGGDYKWWIVFREKSHARPGSQEQHVRLPVATSML